MCGNVCESKAPVLSSFVFVVLLDCVFVIVP